MRRRTRLAEHYSVALQKFSVDVGTLFIVQYLLVVRCGGVLCDLGVPICPPRAMVLLYRQSTTHRIITGNYRGTYLATDEQGLSLGPAPDPLSLRGPCPAAVPPPASAAGLHQFSRLAMTLLSSMSPLRRRLLRLRFVTLLKAVDRGAPVVIAAAAAAGVFLVGMLDGVCSTSIPPSPVLLQGEEDGEDLSLSHL